MNADYVIVGAGSAGCHAGLLRLAEAGRRVTVIEHGGSDAGPFIQMPGALSYPMNMGIYDWGFATEPEPHLGGRVLATPRGEVIGGVLQHQRDGLCPGPCGTMTPGPRWGRMAGPMPMFFRISSGWNIRTAARARVPGDLGALAHHPGAHAPIPCSTPSSRPGSRRVIR